MPSAEMDFVTVDRKSCENIEAVRWLTLANGVSPIFGARS